MIYCGCELEHGLTEILIWISSKGEGWGNQDYQMDCFALIVYFEQWKLYLFIFETQVLTHAKIWLFFISTAPVLSLPKLQYLLFFILIINFSIKIIINNNMEMQKMLNSLKNPHRDFKIRFSYSQQLSQIAQAVRKNEIKQEVELLDGLILSESNNIRQKLKIYKRYIDSSDAKDAHQRDFCIKYMVDLHIKEYIFGITESKPVLMNTLKRINQLKPLTIEHLNAIVSSVLIQEYQESRNLLQLLDMLIRSGNKQFSQKAPYLQVIFSICLRQFDLGTTKIQIDSFKLRWIQYFVDVLRSLNNIFRLFSSYLDLSTKQRILNHLRDLSKNHKILTKEVLTQIFLLLIQINPNQIKPERCDMICIIHYLHARNIILGQNILPQLMNLLPTLKQTQQKCQLAPILLKAFQNYYSQYSDKQNVFDIVVALFQVGRSIYSYLEEIVSIIMKDSEAHWNLQGNFIRKFFIATVALKNGFSTQIIFAQWPTIIHDIMTQAGNMTIPYANDCAQKLFQKLYEQCGKDYQKWIQRWIKQYKACLLTSNRGYIRGIIEFINPILLAVNSQPKLLKEIVAISQSQNNKTTVSIGVISLLKCFKELNKIKVDNKGQIFVHVEDSSIIFTKNQIKDMLLNNDSNVALKALQFLTVNQKVSLPMEPLQLQLALQFYKYSLKTSLPQYRKSYLNVTKKMLDRLRTVYENELTKTQEELKKNKRYKPRQFYPQFKKFLQNLIVLSYQNIFPDVIFQLANPALQILHLIGTYFNRNEIQVKKGQILQPSHILKQTTYFEHRNFQNLLCCLQSSYESVRILSHQILTFFYDISALQQLRWLWSQSLVNANKLTIKSYEYACRILAFISQTYPHILQLPNKYKLKELNICQMFLIIMKQRYVIFKAQFATQEESYYRNLIHGILTVFSYTFDHLASAIRANPQHFKPHFEDIKSFLTEFFDQINQIILFSVQICSSNISTVVLDSLPQSQTDKKYKVDCRGHFLEQTSKNVGSFFQTTALLTSMQNEEQGIENMLVVSFYLLTRQAGLVFQSIGNMVGTNHSNIYIPSDSLVSLVYTYFYALINLKHMGSVDRISNGLGKMAKVIFDNEDKKLSQLPQKLLQKLLTNLKDGNFTNILRRSAGVPYAFTCLLKSEALKRKQMIENTITTLLQLSGEQINSVQLRIHSLNILKKLFQDGDLKGDLDPYVSNAFVSSIRGFTSEQWGVRNSSLMLFSVLANRTVGIKPTFNLLQFFHRCPELLQFFTRQLQNMELNTMYPPLYPIVLLLSRLLPFDAKEKPRMANKSELNLKQIRKDKLLQMLPLIERAGKNNNYMGRVMTAKAILPFMQINGIIPYCLQLLKDIASIRLNNQVHYKLSTAYHLLASLLEITKDQKYEVKIDGKIAQSFEQVLFKIAHLVERKQSNVVTELMLKIIHHVIGNYRHHLQQSGNYNTLIETIFQITKKILKQYLSTPNLILPMNMGHSVAIKQCLHLQNLLFQNLDGQTKIQRVIENYLQFLIFLKGQIENNENYLLTADTEIIEEYLQEIAKYLAKSQLNQPLNHTIQSVIRLINLATIASDNILIQVLTIRSILKIVPQSNLLSYLQQLQMKTNNHFLKIAIFKYIQSININHPILLPLLKKFSRPQELEELRQCCVEYLQLYPTVQESHFIIYIRLLEDQQYEIRLETSKIISPKLALSQYNEEVLKNYLLERLSVKGFQELLLDASDYQVKIKNSEQDRIFSYDKPNKYRSDINNIVYCLLNNKLIFNSLPLLGAVIEGLFSKLNINLQATKATVEKYSKDIINRNEYQFETIVRLFLTRNPYFKQQFEAIFSQHPLLQKIFKLYDCK